MSIFLHSFILWQIDAYLLTYWLWALSKVTVTLIEEYLVDWVFPEKNPNRGSRRGLEDIFEKALEFLGLSRYLWKLWIPEKKRVHRRKFCKIVLHSFFGLEISTRQKAKTHGNSTWVFLDHLITSKNSTSFLIDPRNFFTLLRFFNIPTPWNLHVPNLLSSLPPSPLFWIFLE